VGALARRTALFGLLGCYSKGGSDPPPLPAPGGYCARAIASKSAIRRTRSACRFDDFVSPSCAFALDLAQHGLVVGHARDHRLDGLGLAGDRLPVPIAGVAHRLDGEHAREVVGSGEHDLRVGRFDIQDYRNQPLLPRHRELLPGVLLRQRPRVRGDHHRRLRFAVSHHHLDIREAELVLLAVPDLDGDAGCSHDLDAGRRREDPSVALLAVRDLPDLVGRVLDVVASECADRGEAAVNQPLVVQAGVPRRRIRRLSLRDRHRGLHFVEALCEVSSHFTELVEGEAVLAEQGSDLLQHAPLGDSGNGTVVATSADGAGHARAALNRDSRAPAAPALTASLLHLRPSIGPASDGHRA
jgi:hypothetical protein